MFSAGKECICSLSSNYEVFSSSFTPNKIKTTNENYLDLFSGFVFPEVKTKRKGDERLCRVGFSRAR